VPDITSYPAIVTVEGADVIPIVDVSDPTQSPAGTTKIITVSQLGGSGGGGGGSGYALLSGAEYTGYVAPSVASLSYASTITITATQGNDFRVTLTGSPTFAAPVSPTDGQTIQIWLTQDGTGSRLVTWNAAFDFGTGGSAPVLSTAAGATDVVGFSYNAGTSLWKFLGSTTGGNAAGIGVTLTGTPAAGLAPVATSPTAARWASTTGTHPEDFGTITGTSGDQVALTAAIAAINAGTNPGPLVIEQPCAVDSTFTLLPGVDILCTGQGNRGGGVFPDTFVGGCIQPSSSFPTGSPTPLMAIGTSGAPTTNPCGVKLRGLCMSGVVAGTSSTYAANCIGILITDTADVYMDRCFLGNFDRPGSTGTCVQLASGTAGNGVGFESDGSIFSASWRGIYGDGAGITDLRLRGGLLHACLQNVTLGATAGGGGLQMNGVHATYTGASSGGYHLSLGSQAGDYSIVGNYFDQDGSDVCVQLANDKGVFNSNHLLAASTSTAVSLVAVSVGSPAEMSFQGNECNLNGSSVTALLQLSGHSGIPSGAIRLDGNVVFGGGGSFISAIIDSASAAIPQTPQPNGNSSDFLCGNGTYANPSVAAGTVSGQYLCVPTVVNPGSLTTYTASGSTLSAFSSSVLTTNSFLAPASGTVVVTVTCSATMASANQVYGFALADHGTTTPVGNVITCEVSSANIKLFHNLVFVVSGLTSGSSYQFDLLGAIATGTLTIQAIGQSGTTPTGTLGAPVTITVAAV
jgi:hypothetical protein